MRISGVAPSSQLEAGLPIWAGPVLIVLLLLAHTQALADDTVRFQIGAQALDDALFEFARQSGQEILFVEAETEGLWTSAVAGYYPPEVALRQLLASSSLDYRITEHGTVLVGNIEIAAGDGGRTDRSEGQLAPMVPKAKGPSVLARAGRAVAALLLGSTTSVEAAESDAQGPGAAAEEDAPIEVVVVTGIRGSMQQSLERKRNADHFVDAITAEDIGAFPDQNLAESLQRISGVAIDRKSGEGAFVSVRGLGPQFVQTTIGGRVAASNVAPGSHDGRGATNANSRAVGFHAFQSGLVQAAEVHKSPRADHVEGGLGGFVDIQPRKPFDLGGRHVALSLDSTRNELADDTAPGVFALFSDVLSDTVGFMVSAQWDNRVFRSDSLHQYSYAGPRTVTIDGVEIGTGYYPRQILYELHLTDRDRLNISSSLQWQPSGRIDVTFDVLYTDNTTDEADYWRDYRLQQGHPRLTAATLEDDNGTGIFTMVSTSGAGAFMQHATEVVDNVAATYGANLQFQATDKVILDFDVTVSDTQAPIANRDALMRNTRAQMTYHKYGPGVIPSLTSSSPLTDTDFWEVQKMSAQKHVVDDRVSQFRVDATHVVGGNWLDAVQVGARTYRQARRDRHRYLNSVAFRGSPITDFGGSSPFPAESDFLSGLGARYPGPSLSPNFDGFQQAFITRPNEILNHGGGFNTGTEKSLAGFTQGDYSEDLNHRDNGSAVYAMVMFSGELGDTPYSGNFGVRYVDNSTTTAGIIVQPVELDLSDPGTPQVIVSPPRSIDVGNDYTEVLPSLNLRFHPTDDFVVRGSVAKVFSRPNYGALNPQQSVQPRPRTMRAGNPKLLPTTAVQFDLSLEWYFADYSIASIGLFTKDIEAFVQSEITPTPFGNIVDPETNLPLVLTVFRPLNTGKSDMRGIELAFQRTFVDVLPAPFDGLGVIANYTFIDSGSDFENEITGAAYGIPGLSENTINFTLFYEKGPFSGRASYNFRDDFLDVIADGQGHPYFVDSYDQWDASFGYALNDNVTFAVEAINLTDENVYYYNLLGTGTQAHFTSAINAGRRLQFGVRFKI